MGPLQYIELVVLTGYSVHPQGTLGDVQVGHLEKFLHWRDGQALERAAEEGGGVTMPGSVWKSSRQGTECCGLVGRGTVCSKVGLNSLGGRFQHLWFSKPFPLLLQGSKRTLHRVQIFSLSFLLDCYSETKGSVLSTNSSSLSSDACYVSIQQHNSIPVGIKLWFLSKSFY